jgi:hypothetical protein
MNVEVELDKHDRYDGTLKTQEVLIKDEGITLKFEYSIVEKFDHTYGKHCIITLYKVDLELKFQEASIERFKQLENHKIVLQLKVMKREGTMLIQSIYIGRPQSIFTSSHGGTRTYKWISHGGDIPFHGIGFKRVHDLTDQDHISKSPNISPRPKEEYVPDNDSFHNEVKILPVVLEEGQVLNIQFYNLKFSPPKLMELHLKFSELRDLTQIKIGKATYVNITAEPMESKFHITEVALIAHKYLLVLHYMGEYEVPMTI